MKCALNMVGGDVNSYLHLPLKCKIMSVSVQSFLFPPARVWSYLFISSGSCSLESLHVCVCVCTRMRACVHMCACICACVCYLLIFILVLFRSPELKATEKEVEVVLKFPEAEALSPPILQINDVSFGYSSDKMIFSNVNLGATLESRICIVSSEFFFFSDYWYL